MKLHSNLSLNKKIAQLRKSKGISQASLAEAVGRSIMHISRIEREESACDEEMLRAIKSALGIENAPLMEHELEEYIDRLWIFNDYVHANNLHDAKKIQGTLSQIHELPFERNLILLYLMVETRLLFKENDLAAGEERLATAEALLDGANPESLHLYHRNIGFLLTCKQESKAALKHYLQCLNYETYHLKADAGILYSIGANYLNACKPWHALIYFEQAKIKYDLGRAHPLMAQIDNGLAYAHMLVGEFGKAEQIYNEALAQAKRTNNPYEIGIAQAGISHFYHATGNHAKALEVLNQAMELFKDHPHYNLLLPSKALLLLYMKDYARCKDALEQCRALTQVDENNAMIIEMTGHMLTIDKSESADYLMNIVIPHFRARNNTTIASLYQALACCDFIEAHYRKNRKIKKANEIAVIGRDIFKEMYHGELDLD